MPNGTSYRYHFDKSISVLRDVERYFFYILIQILTEHSSKQCMETLIRSRVLRRLVLICFICKRPTKRALGLHGLILAC